MTYQFCRFKDGYFCPKVGNGEGNCLSIKPVRRVPHQANPVGQEKNNSDTMVSHLAFSPIFTQSHPPQSHSQPSPSLTPQSHSQSSLSLTPSLIPNLHPVSPPSLIPNLHPVSFPVFTQSHPKFCVCEYRTVVLTVNHLA